MRSWSADLGEFPATDDYIPTMAAGVAEELTGYDWQDTLRARDRMLLQILAAKRAAPEIP